MAKVSGLTTSVTVASNDISNDITSINVDTPYGVQDITGLDKSAVERLLLRADCTGTMNGVFNTTASKSHATLKTPGSKAIVIVYPGPATLTFTAVTTNYALSMGADGSLTWSCNWSLSSGTAAAWT
jgi:hypothetical protein